MQGGLESQLYAQPLVIFSKEIKIYSKICELVKIIVEIEKSYIQLFIWILLQHNHNLQNSY